MKKNQKTRRAQLFTLAALLVVLMSNVYVGRAVEPDPRILWVADSAIGRVDGFAVHPNGNIFSHRNGIVSEIDGKTGKLLRFLPKFSQDPNIASIDISNDGKYLAISYTDVVIIDLSDLTTRIVGKGNPIKFTSDSKSIVFGPQSPAQPFEGSDSTLVVVNLESGERRFVKNTEDIGGNIAFSPDGRYMATGGSYVPKNGSPYTTLKLWDATTLTLIKELVRYDNQNYQIGKIQFSPDSRTLCVGLMSQILFFELQNNSLYHILNGGYYNFINDSLMVYNELKEGKMKVINYLDFVDKFDLGNFYGYRELLVSPFNKSIIFDFIGENENGLKRQKLICFDFDKIMSVSGSQISKDSLMIKYEKGIISIMNIPHDFLNINLKIVDLSGKIMYEQVINYLNNDLLRIKLNLSNGLYFLNLSNTSNSKIYKFIVTE